MHCISFYYLFTNYYHNPYLDLISSEPAHFHQNKDNNFIFF